MLLSFFKYLILCITSTAFAFGWILTDTVPLDKVVRRLDSQPYVDTEQVDLCSVRSLKDTVVYIHDSKQEACIIDRQYSHMSKTDTYLIDCDSLISSVRRCSRYFRQ